MPTNREIIRHYEAQAVGRARSRQASGGGSAAAAARQIAAELNASLIDYWRCDESSGTVAADTKGSENLSGVGTSAETPGKLATYGRRTNDSYSVFMTTPGTPLSNLAGGFGLSFWLAPLHGATFFGDFVHVTAAADDNFVIFGVFPNATGSAMGLDFYLQTSGGGFQDLFLPAAIPYGSYSHVAVAHGSQTQTTAVYVNGAFRGLVPALTPEAGGKFSIGGAGSRWSEISYFDAPLTTAQVAFLYNGGVGKTWVGGVWS